MTCMCMCMCPHAAAAPCLTGVSDTLHISISSFCLESQVDVGQIETTPTGGETLTDILIDLNTDFTCRPPLLLCTLSRRASLSCKLCNAGRLVPRCSSHTHTHCMQTEALKTLGCKHWFMTVRIMICTRTEAVVNITTNHCFHHNPTEWGKTIQSHKDIGPV